MRKTNLLALLLLTAAPLYAVQPQFWRVNTTEEFLAGEIDALSITSRGELVPGPHAEKLATVDDPFVLSQTTDTKGRIWLGTGNEGHLYRIDGSKIDLVWTAEEPEIYAVASRGETVWAGTSPHGKLYRIDGSGNATAIWDPEEAYIWDIEIAGDGSIFVATGLEGRVYRVTPDGKATLWFEATEPHIRSLAIAGPKRILAGGSGEGRIYEIEGEGNGRALFDSSLTEITDIHVDATSGRAFAAAVTSVLPTTPPARQQTQGQQQNRSQGNEQPKQDGSTGGEQQPTVEVSFTFDDFVAPTPATGGSVGAEVLRIEPDGYVEIVRRFDREIVYAVTGTDGDLFVATGPNGRIYRITGGEVALVASLPEKQVVSFSRGGSRQIATTTNGGAVYRISERGNTRGEFRSPVKDTERFSRFGQYRIEGRALEQAGLTVAFRSGNTATPDATWSAWRESNGIEGQISAPAARFLQWKVAVEKPSAAASVDAVTVAWVNRNVKPSISNVTVHDPGVIFLAGNYPPAPQVVEATNPDEFGIFTSLDTSRDRSDLGKKYFRKGYRTISWKASDPNGDTLRYDLSFRRTGSDTWLKLRENLQETQFNFDTSQLPDGRYEVRIVASDAHDNPDQPLTDGLERVEFDVDNTPPSIRVGRSGGMATITVADAISPVVRGEYAVDAEKWIRFNPVDGIADSRTETYRLPAETVGKRFVIVRFVDSFFNVSSATVTVD